MSESRKRARPKASAEEAAVEEAASFADAMGRILSREVDAPAPVLARRKTANEAQMRLDRAAHRAARERAAVRKSERRKGLVKPSVESLGYERQLRKVATRGVVALFNAVSKHQKLMSGASDTVGTEQQKKQFLDILKSKTGAKGEKREGDDADDEEGGSARGGGKKGDAKKRSWLQDDFLVGSRAEDWEEEGEDVPETAEERKLAKKKRRGGDELDDGFGDDEDDGGDDVWGVGKSKKKSKGKKDKGRKGK